MLIPREIFFGNPEKVMPSLSPDGSQLAYIAPDEGVLNVWVRTLGKYDDIPVTRDRGRGIRGFFWARNSRQILYVQDKDGDENWHVYAIPATGGEDIDLTPVDGVQSRIIGVDYNFPDEILIGLNDRIPQLHDIYRINLTTGERTLEVKNDLGAIGWVADHRLRIRIAILPQPDGGMLMLHRDGPDAEWSPLLSWGLEDSTATSPLLFASDDQTLYLENSIGSDTAELRSLHIPTGEERILARNPETDVSSVFIHPTTRKIQAVEFIKEKSEWVILDPAIEEDFKVLEELHYGDFSIISRDKADTTWLIAYTQDKGSVVYFTYHRKDKSGTFLFSARPQLDGLQLAEMKPVSFAARDGMELFAYLTLPAGATPENLPVVINVHGGPWSRDEWGYVPEAQWLANRGYATLQVNFRGSLGYGKAYTNAGDREWGGKMQDDITDAVNWLIEKGIADPKRIGIYGGSYGGFAVLSGLTKTPDIYACGVDLVGPSNLMSFINTIPPYWEPLKAIFFKRVGIPEEEEEFLKSRSPLFHIDRIKAPLLIAQGANDPRVKRAESIQIRDALEKTGKIVEYIEFADEGHGFVKPENRIKFYAAAEKFLAEHLGGEYES